MSLEKPERLMPLQHCVDMKYQLRFVDSQVIEEELWLGDKLLLQRENRRYIFNFAPQWIKIV